ncbi:MAG TPA: hypothetical protein VGL99_19265 [Chloroflexota bacterium]
MTPAEARMRLALGIAQMVLAAAVPFAWLGGAAPAVIVALVLAATVCTAFSVARWGGFWRGR